MGTDTLRIGSVPMFLTKHPNQIWYLYFIDHIGKRRRISTKCRLKSDALQFLQSFKEEEQIRLVKRNRTTLSLFSTDFLKYSESIHTAKTLRSNKTALAEFLRVTGDIALQKLTPREIETFLAQKTQEASVWTARKYFLALSSVFETAKRWNLISVNPFRSVKKPRVPEIQPACLTQSDCEKLFKVIDDRDFGELVQCALLTGMRQGEILALQWDAVDFARKAITVRNTTTFLTKNKRERIIPMNQSLWGMLLQRKERTGGRVPEISFTLPKRKGACSLWIMRF